MVQVDPRQPITARHDSVWPPRNAIRGLFAGALTGAGLPGAAITVCGLVAAPEESFGSAVAGGFLIVLGVFISTLPVWALGLIMIGIPGWWMLWALGWRSPWAGAAFGGLATFMASSLLLQGLGLHSAADPKPFLIMTTLLGLSGAVAGWVVVVVSRDQKEAAR